MSHPSSLENNKQRFAIKHVKKAAKTLRQLTLLANLASEFLRAFN